MGNYCVDRDVPVQTILLIDKKDRQPWHRCILSHFLKDRWVVLTVVIKVAKFQ